MAKRKMATDTDSEVSETRPTRKGAKKAPKKKAATKGAPGRASPPPSRQPGQPQGDPFLAAMSSKAVLAVVKQGKMGSRFAEDELDVGQYGPTLARLISASCGARNDGTPYFRTSYVLTEGDLTGVMATNFESLLNPNDPEQMIGATRCFRMLSGLGYDLDEVPDEDMGMTLRQIAGEINAASPKMLCRVVVKITAGRDRNFCNVDFKSLLEE